MLDPETLFPVGESRTDFGDVSIIGISLLT